MMHNKPDNTQYTKLSVTELLDLSDLLISVGESHIKNMGNKHHDKKILHAINQELLDDYAEIIAALKKNQYLVDDNKVKNQIDKTLTILRSRELELLGNEYYFNNQQESPRARKTR